MTDTLYEIDPTTIVFPVAENCVIQRLGQQDFMFFDDATAVLQFMEYFERPTSLESARARSQAQTDPIVSPGATSLKKLDRKTFDYLAESSLKSGVLREVISDLTPNSTSGGFDPNQAKVMLTAINLIAEDITGDISAMGAIAFNYVEKQTQNKLHNMLLKAAGELTSIATALAQCRNEYVNAQLVRLSQGTKQPRLHLGSGGNNLEGWYNIDFAPAELSMNLRWGLPFNANSIEYIFLAHLFEHLYKRRDAPQLLKEIFRVLKPGGVVRIIVPDASVYMRAYVESDEAFFV